MASLPTPSADSRNRAAALREALASRVVVADGAMGTMLQAQDPTLEDFQNLEGCNEILNITRPDIVRSVHQEYFAAACRLRRDQHLRCQPRRPGRVRHPRARPRTLRGRRPHRPRGRRRVHRLHRPPALGPRLHRPRHQAADPRPRPVPPAARRLPAERRGPPHAAAPTPCSSRPPRTSSRPRPPSSAPAAPSTPSAPTCRSSSPSPSRPPAPCSSAPRSAPP